MCVDKLLILYFADKQSSVSLSSHFSGENKNSTSKRGPSFELYIRRIPSLVTEVGVHYFSNTSLLFVTLVIIH